MSLKWTFNITHVYSLRKASINIIEPAPCLTLFYMCVRMYLYMYVHMGVYVMEELKARALEERDLVG